jgi:hypothetical protein
LNNKPVKTAVGDKDITASTEHECVEPSKTRMLERSEDITLSFRLYKKARRPTDL